MRKISTSLLGLLFLVMACNKQDDKMAQVDDEQEEIPVITQRKCATNEVLQEQLSADPTLKLRMQQIEEYTQKVIKNPRAYRLVNSVLEIPVVVHVVYRTSTENISDAQIQSQITVLNEDFRNENADRSNLPAAFQGAASSGMAVRFVLAKTLRVKTKTSSWSTNDAVKYSNRGGSNVFDPAHYLNLWACNLGQGLLGYAQFPGGKAATDGVVVLYSAFGSQPKAPGGVYSTPYDRGRTATHEVGHWLNLRHIWGDDGGTCNGSDLVDDTPNQGRENYGCPSPHSSCSNSGDMFMNYMDYTDDACMYMFSAGQKQRMEALFAEGGKRASFATP
jgi:hypothetical protein